MGRPEDLGHLPPASSLGMVTSPGGSSVGTGQMPHQQQVGPQAPRTRGHCRHSTAQMGCVAAPPAPRPWPWPWSGLEHAQRRTDVTLQGARPRKHRIAIPKAGRGLGVHGAGGWSFLQVPGWAHSSQTSCQLQPLRLLWIRMPLIVFEFAFLFIFNPAPLSQPHRPASAPNWGVRAGGGHCGLGPWPPWTGPEAWGHVGSVWA